MKRPHAPGAERLTKRVSDLVEAALAGDAEAAASTLDEIGVSIPEGVERRPGVPLAAAIEIFERDCWTCRYCGTKTIPVPVLLVLSSLYPDRFPHYPASAAGREHPAYLLISTSLDHVDRNAQDDRWRDPANLVTSCWLCHFSRADFNLDELGWDLLRDAEVRSDWDGLTGAYPELWRLAGEPDAEYHRHWIDVLPRRKGDGGGRTAR